VVTNLPKVVVPGPDGQPVDKTNIFVGGFADDSRNKLVENSASMNSGIYGNNYYATHSDIDDIDALIAQIPEDQTINLIGHSWSGQTAAQAAVDNPGKIDTLVTIDPVGYGHPNFSTISNSVNQWINVDATGNPNSSTLDDISNGNLVAGLGGAWNDGPTDNATMQITAPVNHSQFDTMMNTRGSNGKSPLQILNDQ
jgi:pimeloyl-ACP methyl ester carboxylesterase